MPICSKTAVLVFSRSVGVEVSSKELLKDTHANIDFISLLNKRVKRVVKNSRLPVVYSNENNQVGKSFGERLSHAIQTVFTKGFESVLIVGNDCPDLRTKDIVQAGRLLKKSDFVIGPDLRGGTYLMGMNKTAFNKQAFEKLEWQTKNLLVSINSYTNRFATTFHQLKHKFDLNFTIDIQKYWDVSNLLRRLINLAFYELYWPKYQCTSNVAINYATPTNRRGP